MNTNTTRFAPAAIGALLLLLTGASGATDPSAIWRIDHEGFTIWLDCIEHGAVRFRYNAQRDTGNAPRDDEYRFDPDAPPECQPISTDTFHTVDPAPKYDRSHLVPVNHLDYSEEAVRQSFYMSNILPMTTTLNRSAWYATEQIVECYRDQDELLVIGGVVWGDDESNDYFVGSHGIKTPDKFWKVVIRGNGKTIAWLIPNNADATRANLDKFLITPKRLQKATGAKLPEVPKAWQKKKPRVSWPIPPACDPS